MLTIINSGLAINKKVSKIYTFSILQDTFFSLQLVGTILVGIVFVGTDFAVSMILSRKLLNHQ